MNNNLYPGNIYYPDNYVEGYLKKNIGKEIEAHVSFCDSIEWRDSIFRGTLEDVGKDFMVIKDRNKNYIIWNIYIDYLILNN